MSTPSLTYPPVEQLREKMEAEDLTQAFVASELGVSQRTIQYWLAGAIPQKRYRRVLREWLRQDDEQAA